jgi:hypothetical protein
LLYSLKLAGGTPTKTSKLLCSADEFPHTSISVLIPLAWSALCLIYVHNSLAVTSLVHFVTIDISWGKE